MNLPQLRDFLAHGITKYPRLVITYHNHPEQPQEYYQDVTAATINSHDELQLICGAHGGRVMTFALVNCLIRGEDDNWVRAYGPGTTPYITFEFLLN